MSVVGVTYIVLKRVIVSVIIAGVIKNEKNAQTRLGSKTELCSRNSPPRL